LPPLPLLFATIQRRAIDRARQEDRRARREQVAGVNDAQPWFDTGVEDRELSRLMQAALADLPAEQREVITLKVWGELTFAEIAEALDIPLNTAASRHRYGMDALRKLTKQVLT
jgi:RNA polymerase sigma-70 factor (ECF subfamily)